MHDYVATVIADEAREQTRLLHDILRALRGLSKQLQHANQYDIHSGVIREGDSPMPITPGSTHTFNVTVEPADATFIPADSTFTSSDPVNAPVTIDPTGLTVTVDVPATAPVGTSFTLTWTYTNADGTIATSSITETIVAAVVDVTGGTITETT